MKLALAALLLIFIVGAMISCYNDNLSELTPSSGVAGSCDTTGVMTYALNVVPILQTNCGSNNSCHGSGNTSGYDLSNFSGVHSLVVNGELMNSINWTGTVPQMPPNGSKMSSCKISQIQKWVNSGAPNN